MTLCINRGLCIKPIKQSEFLEGHFDRIKAVVVPVLQKPKPTKNHC